MRFDCTRPKAGILQMWVPILPQHIWSKISPADAQNKFQNPTPVIGSGPFQVVDWVKDQYVRVVANKNYWGGAPKIDGILFRIYTNQETEAADLRSGAIQYADVAPAQYQSFVDKSTWTTHKATDDSFENMGINCYTLGPSTGNPVLKDWRFRNALNWAIDRRAIAAIAYSGAAIPATSFLPSGYWKAPLDYHWQPPASEAYTYDPVKAGQLLDAAGYKEVNGVRLDHNGKPIKLRLWAVTEKNQYIVAAKLIAGYLQKIGLKVTLQTMDNGAIDDKLYNTVGNTFKPDYDLFVWGWGGDFEPGFLLSIFLTSRQRLERLCLVRPAVRPALPAAGRRARPPEAQGDHLADGADRLPAEPLHPPGLPRDPAGLRHPALARLGAPAGRHGDREQLLELPERGPQRGRRRELRRGLARTRRDRRGGRSRAGRLVGRAAPAPAGGRGDDVDGEAAAAEVMP